jgi:aryl-alcohol dehydrogenase-like predicted oxidoreductase
LATRLDEYRLLGRSGLRVSPLSLGAMTFGVGNNGSWGSSDAEAAAIVNAYIEAGGNFIDTANFYSQGRSEEVLAPLIAGKQDSLVISTKYTLTMKHGDPNASGNQRKNMVQSVEGSLRRLKADCIDLFYLHKWDFRTGVDEVMRGLDDLVRAGKIHYAAISDTPAWQVARMQTIADLRGWAPLVALQIEYNLIDRTGERDMMPMAAELGLGVCPYSPLGGGVLTGKYSRADLAPSDNIDFTSRKGQALAGGRLTERNLDIADVVAQVAKELGRKPSHVALAWSMQHRAVVSPLIGARTPEQLADNLGALDISLDDDQLRRLDEVSAIELGVPHDNITSNAVPFMFGFVNVEQRGGVEPYGR